MEQDNFREDFWYSAVRWVKSEQVNASSGGLYRDCEKQREPKGEFMGGVPLSALTMLDHAWKKEIGVMGRFCSLLGIRSGKNGPYLVVKPVNAAAASEINLRSSSIVRNINKYFRNPWIKGIKIDSKI